MIIFFSTVSTVGFILKLVLQGFLVLFYFGEIFFAATCAFSLVLINFKNKT